MLYSERRGTKLTLGFNFPQQHSEGPPFKRKGINESLLSVVSMFGFSLFVVSQSVLENEQAIETDCEGGIVTYTSPAVVKSMHSMASGAIQRTGSLP